MISSRAVAGIDAGGGFGLDHLIDDCAGMLRLGRGYEPGFLLAWEGKSDDT